MALDNVIPHGKPGIASFETESYGNSGEPLFGDGITRTVSRTVSAAADLDLPIYSVVSLLGGVLALAISGAAAGAASGTVTIANAVPVDGDEFVIAGVTYTFMATPAAAYDVDIGADIATTRANLIAAINGTGTPGTEYFAGTEQNPDVYATAGAAGVTNIIARVPGDEGNAITLAKTFATGANGSVSAATLANGSDEADIRPYGITAAPIVMANGESMDVPIYVSGHFNMNALNFDATFVTDEQKMLAFEGSLNPMIHISKPKYSDENFPT